MFVQQGYLLGNMDQQGDSQCLFKVFIFNVFNSTHLQVIQTMTEVETMTVTETMTEVALYFYYISIKTWYDFYIAFLDAVVDRKLSSYELMWLYLL